MKIQRFLTKLCALTMTIPLVLSFIHAHPGHTDSNGGHTDRDIGEYHYHHGYPAHDHYDMDNNGTIDCPYDFVDLTGQNSGNSSDRNSSGNWSSGSSWSDYSDNYGREHKTISRLETMLGTTNEPTEPFHTNTSTAPTIWNLFCEFVGDEWTACFIVIDVITCLIFIPLAIFSSRKNLSKLSNIAMPVAFLAAIPPFFVIAFIACELYVIVGLCILIWTIITSLWSWIKELLPQKRPQNVTIIPPRTVADSSKALESKVLHKQHIADEGCTHLDTLQPSQPELLPASSETANPASKNNPHNPASEHEKTSTIPDEVFKPAPEVVFRLPYSFETEVSVHARCRDTCRYLWYETLLIRSRTSPPISSNSCIYIWTALFYTVVKTLRSQDSVNRIYSYFDEVTGVFVTEIQYQQLVIDKVREVYRSIRETLNESGIDPRTTSGRHELWLLIAQYIPEGDDPRLQEEFEASAERIWQTIADVFPQARPYPKSDTEKIQYSVRDDELPFDL